MLWSVVKTNQSKFSQTDIQTYFTHVKHMIEFLNVVIKLSVYEGV